MEFEILDGLPLSGEYDEYQYGAGGDSVAIKFLDESYLDYCAKFSVGINSKTKVQNLGSIFFIIAEGKGYLFDSKKKCVVKDTQIENFTDVVVINAKNYFIACNNTDLYVFDSTGLIWSSGRVSSDGVKIDSVDGSSVSGKVFDFTSWVGFELDLDSFVYHCEWTFPFQD